MLTKESLKQYIPERFISDEHYRKGHIHILAAAPSTEILGLHTPEMKALAKSLAKDPHLALAQIASWQSHSPLTGEGGLSHEERMIWGLTIDYLRFSIQDRIQLIDSFIPAIDNWAICDTFCCNAKWADPQSDILWQYIETLISSSEEFRARVGLILSLAHYLDPEHIVRTLDTVVSRSYSDSDPYYIRMAVAWLFAEALVKQYDLALPYIKERRLSKWIHNKSIQKARESFRISPDQKSFLQSLKIKR
jgi:3-methyladenine DNA glycosylase AlkD